MAALVPVVGRADDGVLPDTEGQRGLCRRNNYTAEDIKLYIRKHCGLCVTDPGEFGQSQCRRFQNVYVIFRVCAAFVFTSIWVYDVFSSIGDTRYMIYINKWAYIVLVASTCMEAYLAIDYRIKFSEKIDVEPQSDIADSPVHYCQMPLVYKISWVLYNIVLSSAPIVSAISLIVYGRITGDVVHIFNFYLNTVYSVTNRLVTGIPTRLCHFWHAMLFFAGYILFTLLYYLFGGTSEAGEHFIYWWADYRDNRVRTAGLILALFMAVPLVHTVSWAQYKMRRCIFRVKRKTVKLLRHENCAKCGKLKNKFGKKQVDVVRQTNM